MSTPLTPVFTVESVPIDHLQPHPRNPRQGDVGAIIQSIKANGVYRPLIVQRSSYFILSGTHTWRALKSEGHETAQVIFLDVDDHRAVAILLADNRTSDLASYDQGALESLLVDHSRVGLEGTGYDLDDLQRMLVKSATPLQFNDHRCCRSD